MYDYPTAIELLAAARTHMEQSVIPALKEPRLRYQTLVAANVLAIIERELATSDAYLVTASQRLAALLDQEPSSVTGPSLQAEVAEQTQHLCDQIRAGAYDEGANRAALFTHLRQTAEDELHVANPVYLGRFQKTS
ncbi:MAG: hypothetical protein GFH27_549293n278 [Chloroflexi bacterium AL-W]|nr:hypothetical protein [Chloroflexi bacterium AL-N1]NOK67607.1 hypothetical protein [Chloroflexi bacterium AL-N10]NOK75623.1 hypothetical protein [Chloroflexi bacterium AL-N5]NOK82411.1 hypothetical protein [Chloroflexi bacterium AL-W]NOK90256.1 hypothetical protein [Chloroflexi bacterium AL-N15]